MATNRAQPTRGARSESGLPESMAPQLATLVDSPPGGDRWLHEIKHDGYRLLSRVESGDVRLLTRNGNDWTSKLPTIGRSLRTSGFENVWVDGELVALSRDGRSSFSLLQQHLGDGDDSQLVYFLFDLLYLRGRSLLHVPLTERKRQLRELMPGGPDGHALRYSDHVQGDGERFFEHACRIDLEGIVSKRSDGPYRSGRSRSWCKTKCQQQQEFVVVGYTESTSSGRPFGALLLAVFDRHQLVYSGRVGTGFNSRNSAALYSRLQALTTPECPLARRPPVEGRERVHWVRPELVVQVRFSNWTAGGSLRHPAFQGLREDKAPLQVKRELAQPSARDGDSTAAEANAGDVGSDAKLSNADKVLYPESGFSKADLATYYRRVAAFMLPWIADRPLMLVRCPDGYQSECFYQKHIADEAGEGIETVEIDHRGRSIRHPVVRTLEGLYALVQLGTLEIHGWGSRSDRPDRPDQITFDLDPGPRVPWDSVIPAAQLLRTLLEGLGLRGFLKTTGGKGLHVVVPIARRYGWDEVKAFSKAVAAQLVRFDARQFSATLTKSGREDKIFIDYLRNGRGATAIVPFSTRARAGVPVSVPIPWEALESGRDAVTFSARSPANLLEIAASEPWKEYQNSAASLTRAMWAALDRH